MGYNWTCNICQKSNTVPLKYFCELNEMGERRDLKDRVELNYGSYDIKAGQEYFSGSNHHARCNLIRSGHGTAPAAPFNFSGFYCEMQSPAEHTASN